ncbi:MAG: peroxiredoxin-like family protein [Kofleriaceae bacterium]
MLTRADDLATMSVLDEDGNRVTVGDLWRDKTAVLVFTRHFGCVHCREHAAQLHREGQRIRDAGAELFVIGNGTPSFIEGFRDQTGYTGPIYTDPSLAVYKAAQFKRSVTSTIDPRGFGKALRALAGGQRQTIVPQGDQWQQGGVIVVKPTNDIVWHYVSGRAGDDPSVTQIVSAIRAAA